MNYRAVLIAAVQATGLAAAFFVIPLFGQVAGLFTPVPVMLAYVAVGRREGTAALLLSAGIVAVFGMWQVVVMYLLTFGLMALALGEGLRRAAKPENAVLAGGLLPIAAAAGLVALLSYNIGGNPLPLLDEHLRKSIAEAEKLYRDLGLTDVAAALASVPQSFLYYFIRLLPGILTVTTLIQAASCYGITRGLILRRNPGLLPGAAPTLASWHAPDPWVWPLIASLMLLLAPNEAARLAGLNLSMVFLLVYLVQGIAVIEHGLRKLNMPPFWRSLLISIIIALPVVVAVVGLGVVDIWADFRKVRSAAGPRTP